MIKIAYLTTLQIMFGIVLYFLHYNNLIAEAYSHNVLYIMEAILFVFLVGTASLFFRPSFTKWCSETILGLGLTGTVYGLWIAFSAIDSNSIGDVTALSQVLSVLLNGIGAAIWTTIVGVVFHTWLTGNSIIVRDRNV